MAPPRESEVTAAVRAVEAAVRAVEASAQEALHVRRVSKIAENVNRSALIAPAAIDKLSASALDSLALKVRIVPVTMAQVQPPPSGLAWVRVGSNMRAPDHCGHDFFVPYLGESDEHIKSSNNLAVDLMEHEEEEGERGDGDGTNLELVQSPRVESDDPQMGIVPGVRRCANQTSDVSDAEWEEENGEGLNMHGKYAYRAWDRAVKRIVIKTIMDKLEDVTIRDIAPSMMKVLGMRDADQVVSCYDTIEHRARGWRKKDEEALLKAQQKTEILAVSSGHAEGYPSVEVELQSDSVHILFCRQCYTYDCALHGVDSPRPSVPPPDRSRKDSAPAAVARAIQKACLSAKNNLCWYALRDRGKSSDPGGGGKAESRNGSGSGSRIAGPSSCNCSPPLDIPPHTPRPPLTDDAKAMFSELCSVFGDDFCRISAVMNSLPTMSHVSCSDVGQYSEQLRDALKGGTLLVLPTGGVPVSAKRRRSKLPKSGPPVPKEEMAAMRGGQRLDYIPCNHDGPCNTKCCICVQKGVLCEKFCGCNHSRVCGERTHQFPPCHQAFRGCTCKSAAACVTNSCVCFSLRRECDPDLCRSCMDCKSNIARKSDLKLSCRNAGLRIGERHRTVAGRSGVHGWGIFAVCRIPKNDLIGEYVGEVISQDEAERRGRVYDEINYSFLFNVTEHYAVDSTRLGNKLRYCNHSTTPNCEARLMRVGGDVRVGIYARRAIEANEELYFDYGYQTGPAWAMAGKANASSAAAQRKRRKKDPSRRKSQNQAQSIGPATPSRSVVAATAPVDVASRTRDDSDVPAVGGADRIKTRLRRNGIADVVGGEAREVIVIDLISDDDDTALRDSDESG